MGEDGSPVQIKKQKRESDPGPSYSPIQQSHHPQMQGRGVLKPQPMSNGPSHTPRMASSSDEHLQEPSSAPEEPQQQPPIDPDLFAMYPEPDQNARYGESRYHPYPTTEQSQPYSQPQSAYHIPSLEQIANEVLVDMNGNEPQGHGFSAQHSDMQALDGPDTAPMLNGHAKVETSVDSAVSLPVTEVLEQNAAGPNRPNGAVLSDTRPNEPAPDSKTVHHDGLPAQQSIETDSAKTHQQRTSPLTALSTSPTTTNKNISNLPLYQPPAPPSTSRSPEAAIKRQPLMPNGVNHGKSSSPVESTPLKRKRDSSSTTPAAKSAKKVKGESVERGQSGELMSVDVESLELARMLQQEERGLRRRSK